MSNATKPENTAWSKPESFVAPKPEGSIQPKPETSVKPRPHRSKWLWSLLLIPILGLGYVAYNQFVVVPQQRAKNKVQTAVVERSNLTIAVAANGTVQPERSVNVSPKTSGILKQLLVKEGDTVQQGQVLAYMDNSNLQGQLRQSQGNLAAAEATLQKSLAGNRSQDIDQAQYKVDQAQQALNLLKAGSRIQDIAQAQANLDKAQVTHRQAQDDLRRNQQLRTTGAISQQALNTSRSTRDSAQAVVDQTQQALNLLKAGARPQDIAQAQSLLNQQQAALNLLKAGSRPEDIAQVRAQVSAAQGAVQIIQVNLNDMVIRAPFSGVIAKKFADPGAFVTPTTAGSAVSGSSSSSILTLASTNQIVAQVSEANISQIRLGLTATIQADSYPGKTFTGQVVQIATQSVVVQNVTSFEVKTSVADPQRLLRSGMNVNITFNAGELKNVLVVPTGSIVQQDKSQGVFVAKDKGDPVFVPVVVGTTVNDKTEIKSGLTGTEKVLLSFPPGTRKVSKMTGRP